MAIYYIPSSGTSSTVISATYTTITVNSSSGTVYYIPVSSEPLFVKEAASEVSLSINPDSFALQFAANPENAQAQVMIQNAKGTEPYQQFYTAEIGDGQSMLVIPRHDHLPKGDYDIHAAILRWVGNELVLFEASPTVTVHVP